MCDLCEGKIEYPPRNICSRCGAPLDFDYELETGDIYKCGECQLNPPIYDELRFALVYNGPIREMFHAFKFQNQRRLANPLSSLGQKALLPWLEQWPEATIIPVPLARNKLFVRGYNPTYLIARLLGVKAGLSVEEGALRRIRPTAPQFGLNTKERETNVKGAFAVHQPQLIKGKRVILFDDIHTTGATVRECCKVIKRARPKAMRVATLCRAGE